MTDNEIIQEATEAVTRGLPCAFLVPPLLEVIERKNAENERLKAEAECADGYADALIAKAKSEAYREFAERLENNTLPITLGGEYKYDVITKEGIDNILKKLLSNDMGRYDHYTDSFVNELTRNLHGKQ